MGCPGSCSIISERFPPEIAAKKTARKYRIGSFIVYIAAEEPDTKARQDP